MIEKEFLIEKLKNKTVKEISEEIGKDSGIIYGFIRKYGLVIPKTDILTKDFIIEQYIVKNKSAKQISEEFGCSKVRIYHKMAEYGIPCKNSKISDIFTKEQIEYEYNTLDKKAKEIAKEYNTSLTNVLNALKKYGIQSRKKRRISSSRHSNWKGFEKISGSYFRSIIKMAERRKVEFCLTIEDIWKKFEEQNGLCSYSGIPLEFAGKFREKSEQTASLDRIDSNKGYIKGNVQWVHKTVNKMKTDLDEKTFIQFCKLIGKNLEKDL